MKDLLHIVQTPVGAPGMARVSPDQSGRYHGCPGCRASCPCEPPAGWKSALPPLGFARHLAGLCAGLVLAGLVSPGQAAPAGTGDVAVKLDPQSGRVRLMRGPRQACEYVSKEVPRKPYLQQVFTPAGINVARDQVADHLHHHGLMLAWTVEGVDCWAETPANGKQLDRGMKILPTGFVQDLAWVTADETLVLLQEERRIELSAAAEADLTLITWQSRFTLPAKRASAKITGSRYQGLGLRFLQAMDRGGPFFNSTGKPGVPRNPQWKDWNVDGATWCAYTAAIEGKPVTVAMFSDPKHPRPASWFTMNEPFAYLSGTLSLDREPLVLAQGKPLLLRYGVALWDGKTEAPAVEKAYQKWVKGLGE